jgi:cytochrome c553
VQLKESAKLADAGEEAAPDYQGGDPIAGKTRSELCQGCHGEDGNSLAPLIPKLAGQFSKYITKQIHDYQSGKRKHPIMSAIAATVSDSELADIAAYFASQPRMKGDGEGDSLGQTLFEHGNSSKTLAACIKCHGRNGKGLTPHTSLFPVIGGQRKEYVQKQLMDFRDKIRLNSPGGIMNKITTTLTDAEIEALADYVSAQ